MEIETGTVDNILLAEVFNTGGSVKDDLVFDEPGISIVVQRIGQADSAPIVLTDKINPEDAHSDGAFFNLGGGTISVDVGDSLFSGFNGLIRLFGTFTGGYIKGEWYQVVGYNPNADYDSLLEGTGDFEYAYGPVLNTDTGLPEIGVTVWATEDTNPSPRVAQATTNSLGYANFLLTEGNLYYFWASKDGFNSSGPDGPITVE